MSEKPSIAELQVAIAPPHGTPPRRITDAELTMQQAGYHDFNAIESMVVELREHRRNTRVVLAAPVLLEIAAAVKTLQTEGWDFRSTTMDHLLSALAKVRP